MDDEKLERTIEFILNNQAQFLVDIQKLQEAHQSAEKRLNQLERAAVGLYNGLTDLTKNVNQLTEEVREFKKTQEDGMRELREAQKETDERLNAVILMVERYLSRENGKA
jgi:predicted  nucleic acid-binding Zn-ribbon protein